MGTVIKVENLGKKYIISHQQERYTALRDVMADTAKKAIKKVIGKGEALPKKEEFWALRNISFDVNEGDRIGIIGRNGAGKSTLLKLLSRITEPTEGKIKIKGKIASLLEVGTGFHNELTGKENIMLNGAILGMSKKEILKKFDEIVDFSGVEKFLDTPVKRYSSGMYVRLAFAVAAHLETEILLVDEVLAVGDAEFQKKCLGRMDDISKNEGRTVIFVSHNMGAIRQLVSRCIFLDKGTIIFDGETNECISQYLHTTFSKTTNGKMFSGHIPSEEFPVVIKGIVLSDVNGEPKDTFNISESLTIEILLEAKAKDIRFQAMVQIQNEFGIFMYHCVSVDARKPFFISGIHPKLKVSFPKLKLYPGKYSVDVGVYHPGLSTVRMDKIESAVSFTVNQLAGLDEIRPLGKGSAVVHEIPEWEIEYDDNKLV